ncbi:tRNA (adenosine(37)-N6)-threonylcarbamoyltransferase complex dimerization subunit type 1 TsaB [Cyanobium sp. Morenito 9A2]|uniref:tRNA (adenosine(37)-N6)-threonylcarbamoyltransferase complex dimerization subunit type 1 TsaB n=1 Tax=Cyanobium sp. Morenito 9A2 TaxID=2823718 RepID=UPI0020CF589F|nr:tRNA (adenosine(37)-N6)-threonylcarbamoyltransferase complex dimerization subunit type 1 TsaB [Cyanobium sp. Morenito 9A2]MCP9849902.1 tRNA (adenosine(37)-N6)-threonylcarbamoyltransferase complex dimerization subunit type 1 TsaB [Cyanobium sp. Morenito 9A2]
MSAKATVLLALHSSSDTLAVGLQELAPTSPAGSSLRVLEFPLGRALSTELFSCVEQVLPAARWREISRLAVATGPGGFTGTRLTVVMARTLAQQLAIPLHGVGSFLLIARRLRAQGVSEAAAERFAVVQTLPRHGLVAGLYGADPTSPGGVREHLAPRFFDSEQGLGRGPRLEAQVAAAADAAQLLAIAAEAAQAQRPAPWQVVLPLYPTSPVEPRG